MVAHKTKILVFLLIVSGLVFGIISIYNQEGLGHEFEIQGLTWRTIAYYYHHGIYREIYNNESNLRIIKKAKDVGANYLLIRAFYNGTPDGELIGNDTEAEKYLKQAIEMAHNHEMKVFLTPYVESKEYLNENWFLSETLWTDKVIRWAEFAEENNVEMFAPGVEMNLIFDKERVGEWYKEILPMIRSVYNGKIITAEHYDTEHWKILDNAGSFAGYECIGLTLFPRKEYGGVSDIRNMSDYNEYVETEANTIDMLAEKYNIHCKLAVPMGLDYWNGSYQKTPVPDASIMAMAIDRGLDILENHNFTGVFISHWASEPDHFGKREDVENMIKNHWKKRKIS